MVFDEEFCILLYELETGRIGLIRLYMTSVSEIFTDIDFEAYGMEPEENIPFETPVSFYCAGRFRQKEDYHPAEFTFHPITLDTKQREVADFKYTTIWELVDHLKSHPEKIEEFFIHVCETVDAANIAELKSKYTKEHPE